MSTKTLLTELDPSSFGVKPKCKQCVHFKSYPLFKVKGSPRLCSSEDIGRRENDAACEAFSISSDFKAATPEQTKAIRRLFKSMGITSDFKKSAVRETRQTLLEAAAHLIALERSLLKGFVVGGYYKANNGMEGNLVAWGNGTVTLLLENGTYLTVDQSNVELLQV